MKKNILSELAHIEGTLMGYHEGIDLRGNKSNFKNISLGLLELSKRLNRIQKTLIVDLRIGDLRQWLNEKPKDHLVTDEDIRIMLGLESEGIPNKPFNKKQFIKQAREVKKTFEEEESE